MDVSAELDTMIHFAQILRARPEPFLLDATGQSNYRGYLDGIIMICEYVHWTLNHQQEEIFHRERLDRTLPEVVSVGRAWY